MLNWDQVDTVLLDMDGTLLDLHYDNYFWSEHLPRRYAQIHGGEPGVVRRELGARIRAERGSLNWYCLDYWSRELELDILALKREVADRIALRPHVERFLSWLQQSPRSVWLVTNAHRGGLDLKLELTPLRRWMDRVVVSHDLALAKEDPAFWGALCEHCHFDPARSLLVDDNIAVLQSAARFGVRHLITLRQPDSRQPPREALPFPAIHHFDELLPKDFAPHAS